VIARNAGVAEGTLFRYFATKDDLLNALPAFKSDLCQTMIDSLDGRTAIQKHTQSIWNSYIDWGIRHPWAHNAIRQIAVSENHPETRQQVIDMFPELHEICHRSVRPEFLSEALSPFGDAIFLTLAETTMDFASRDPQKAKRPNGWALKPCGARSPWITAMDSKTLQRPHVALRWNYRSLSRAGRLARNTTFSKSAARFS
jgi:AcrR family transcriptional regulator